MKWVCLKMLCTTLNPMVLLIIIPFWKMASYHWEYEPNIFRQTHMMFMMSLINPSWCLWHANESGIFIGSKWFKYLQIELTPLRCAWHARVDWQALRPLQPGTKAYAPAIPAEKNLSQCQSMSINVNVNQCQSMSINVNQCQSMSINVNQCQSMSINVNQCQSMSQSFFFQEHAGTLLLKILCSIFVQSNLSEGLTAFSGASGTNIVGHSQWNQGSGH